MGQSRGGGYKKLDTLTPGQNSLLDQIIGMAGGNLGQAAQGFAQFLPGGGGGQAISDQAQQQFQRQTIPNILSAYGQGNKGSSALNQALASGAADLNTNIAAQLAQMQLGAAQGLGNLGLGQSQLGVGTPQFAYAQRQPPFWQSLLLGGLNAAGQLGGGAIGGMR